MKEVIILAFLFSLGLNLIPKRHTITPDSNVIIIEKTHEESVIIANYNCEDKFSHMNEKTAMQHNHTY